MATALAAGMSACSSSESEPANKLNTVRLNIAGEKVEISDAQMVVTDEQGDTLNGSRFLLELALPQVGTLEGMMTTDEGDTVYYHSLQELVQLTKAIINDTNKTTKP